MPAWRPAPSAPSWTVRPCRRSPCRAAPSHDRRRAARLRRATPVLFTLLAERYERRSVMVTSNLVFSQWGPDLPRPDGHRRGDRPPRTPLGRARVRCAELANRPVTAQVVGAITAARAAWPPARPAVATAPPARELLTVSRLQQRHVDGECDAGRHARRRRSVQPSSTDPQLLAWQRPAHPFESRALGYRTPRTSADDGVDACTFCVTTAGILAGVGQAAGSYPGGRGVSST